MARRMENKSTAWSRSLGFGEGTLIKRCPHSDISFKWKPPRKPRICMTLGTKNEQRAVELAEQIRAMHRRGEALLPSRVVTWTFFSQRWLENVRPSTRPRYNTAVARFDEFLDVLGIRGSLRLADISAPLLEDFLLWRCGRHFQFKNVSPCSASNAEQDLTIIGAGLERARRRELSPRNPKSTVEHLDVEELDADAPEMHARPFTADEVQLILRHGEPRHFNANDYRPILAFLAFTGARPIEAISLDWARVDFDRRVVFVADSKTPAGRREIPIVLPLESILRVLVPTDGPVFRTRRGTRVTYTPMAASLKKSCKELAIESDSNGIVCCYSFRKFWATTVAEQGMDWKLMIKIFGHRDFRLILNVYYQKPTLAVAAEAMSKIDFGVEFSISSTSRASPNGSGVVQRAV